MDRFTFEVMHSRLLVVVPAGPAAAGHAAAVHAVFVEVERGANEWQAGSPLAAVSRAAGHDAVGVPKGLFDLLVRASAIAEATEGAFDPTWAPLWPLWDFRANNVPDPAAVAQAVARVDHRKLVLAPTLSGGTARLTEPGMALGLGGIAKGWALDRARDLLLARGVHDFLLDIGQVMAHGRNGSSPWRVGVRDPRGPANDAFVELDLLDGSLSTSGDYERYFEIDGVRYHHILDPRTGWPAKGLRSASVVSSDGALADALSTALLVLGDAERALALADKLGVEALVVGADGYAATPSLKARLSPVHPLR